MKSRLRIFPTLVLYLLSAAGFSAYIFADLQTPVRLFLLAVVSFFLFLAGKLLAKEPGANGRRIMERTVFAIFFLYLHLLFTLTLFDPDFGRTGTVSFLFENEERMRAYLETSVNLTPLETVKRYISALEHEKLSIPVILTNLLGNFTALMPMALFLPILSQRCRKFRWFTLATVLTVVSIEGLQLLFMTGACDVDDLILNVAGALLAYFTLKIPPIRKAIQKTVCIE